MGRKPEESAVCIRGGKIVNHAQGGQAWMMQKKGKSVPVTFEGGGGRKLVPKD